MEYLGYALKPARHEIAHTVCPEEPGPFTRAFGGPPADPVKHIQASTCPKCGSYVSGQ